MADFLCFILFFSPCLPFSAEALEFEADEIHDEVMKTTEKHNALCTALKLVDDDCSKESKVSLERFFRTRSASVVSTGSLALDEALGIGGLPKVIFEKHILVL